MIESYKELQFAALPEFRPAQPQVVELGNGLRVYLMEDRELPVVHMRAMVRVGSSYEPAERVGLASVTAQSMRSGGTTRVSGDLLDEELGRLAATIDVSIGPMSGSASASCLAETMPRVLELLADVLRNPAFPEEKLELARSALRTAISRRNDQIGSMAERLFRIAMYGPTSPFAREPEYATVDAVAREDAVRFHADYVRADRTELGLVGDFDANRALDLVRSLLGDWGRAATPVPRVVAEALPIAQRRVLFAEKGDVNQAILYVGGHGVRRDDPDWAALRVGSFVLGAGGFGTRLVKRVRTELGLAYAVGGGFSAEYDRKGLFRALCQTKTESTGRALEAMLAEAERILTEPPTDEETASAKEQILNAEIFDYDSRAEILGRRMTLDYYGYAPDFLEKLNGRIREVTPRDVAAALKRHLDPAKLTIAAVGRSAEFDRPLTAFGPVTTVDLSIPEARR